MRARNCTDSSNGWPRKAVGKAMLCFRYRKLLVPYSEGVLDPMVTSKVEKHLASCTACRAELECVKSVSGALRGDEEPAIEPSPDLWARVRSQIEPQSAPAPVRGSRIPQFAYASAALVFVAVLGWGVIRTQMAPETADRQAKYDAPALPEARKRVRPDQPAAEKSVRQKPAAERKPQASPVRMARNVGPSTPVPKADGDALGAAIVSNPAVQPAQPDRMAMAKTAPDMFVPEKGVARAPSSTSQPTGGMDMCDAIVPAVPSPPAAAMKTDLAANEPRTAGKLSNATPAAPSLGNAHSSASSLRQNQAPASQSADDFVNLAKSQMAQGQTSVAATNFSNALTISKPAQWRTIANSAKESGALDLVASNVQTYFTSNQDPKSGRLLYELQSVQNNQTGMLNTAQQLTVLDPKSPTNWLKLGEAYELAGDKPKALEAYAKAAAGSDPKVAAAAKKKAYKLRKAGEPNADTGLTPKRR